MICDYLRFFTKDEQRAGEYADFFSYEPKKEVWKNGTIRWRFDISGAILGRFTSTDIDLIVSIILENRDKITRFDVAWDYSISYDIKGFYDRNKKPDDNLTIYDGNGTTVQIAKRGSRFFARVYDKRAEIKAKRGVDVGFDWVRVEIECKRDMAAPCARAFLEKNDDVLIGWLVDTRPDVVEIIGDHKPMSKPKVPTRARAGHWWVVTHYRKAIKAAMEENIAEFRGIVGV